MNLLLIYPMFALVCLTAAVGWLVLVIRINAVRSGRMDGRYFKTFNYGEPTELVVKTGRHFGNLFEVPVLFYTGCIVAMVLPVQGFWILFWAWTFVAARCFHAFIHIGPNKIYPRIAAFFLGFLAAVAIWIQIFLQVAF